MHSTTAQVVCRRLAYLDRLLDTLDPLMRGAESSDERTRIVESPRQIELKAQIEWHLAQIKTVNSTMKLMHRQAMAKKQAELAEFEAKSQA